MSSTLLKGCRHLSLELSPYCNLAKEHDWCPSILRDKSGKPTSDSRLVTIIEDAVENLGFDGWVSFHYYNEPLLSIHRIEYLYANSLYKNFMLWTNGLLFDRKHLEKNDDIVKMFTWIYISDYKGEPEFYSSLRKRYPGVKIQAEDLYTPFGQSRHDNRRTIYGNDAEVPRVVCTGVRYELPIDWKGNVHLCCRDWNETYKIGNINDNLLSELLVDTDYERLVNDLQKGATNVPDVCRQCIVM